MESIKQDPAFSVNHCLLSGSVGKRTSVLRPDIDGVVFLNKKQLPLTQEIEAIIDLLKYKADCFGIVQSSITRGSKSVKILFHNGIEMDLLPACTFSQDVYEQYLKVLECIRSYPENYSSYSSSLGDIQKQFLKDQPGPTHQLIRLIKYWYKSLTLDVEIYGGSYLMEILCVTVCNESKTQNSLFTNFKATLQKIYKIDTLRVAFLLEKNSNDKLRWKLLSEDELEKHKNSFSPLILERSCFIIDPSNPYNDLFDPKNLTEIVLKKLKEHAKEMIERVEMLESFESNDLKTIMTVSDTDPGINTAIVEVKLHVDKIFEPHSMSLRRYSLEGIPNEIVYQVDYKCKNSDKLKSAIIDCVSTTFFVENKEAKKVSKTMLTNLESLIKTKARLVESEKENKKRKKYIYSYGLPDVADKGDIKESVERIKTIIQQNNIVSFRESSSKKCHKKCDVTLYVPYVCKENNLALRFSMKWSKFTKENNNLNEKKCCVIN